MAATALVARRVGEKNYTEAAHAGMQIIFFALIVSLFISVAGIAFAGIYCI